MPDDSSLTDFFDDEEGAESGAVAPADVTYEWSDDETACADCGEPTRRRWRDARDGESVFVCVECKDW